MWKLLCKHDWKILSETTTKSRFEMSMAQLHSSRSIELSGSLCNAERKCIQIVTCKECGALKKFVEII